MSFISEVTELKLAAIVAVSTCLGGVGATLVNRVLPDVSTERQTDAQIIQVAIGILSAPIDSSDRRNAVRDTALRTWAVDTVNSVSEISIPEEARSALIRGEALFTPLELAAQAALRDLDGATINLEVFDAATGD